MFGYETNQKQIDRLSRQAVSIEKAIYGSGFHSGISYDLRQLTTWVGEMQAEIRRLNTIIEESGIIDYIDISDIKFNKNKEAYQVNKIKVK